MNIKIARMKKGLTQDKLRRLLHISTGKMVEIEKGNYQNVTIPLAIEIAEILGDTVENLFLKEA